MKSIRIKSASAYGRIVYYPDCEFSRMLCEILGKKCVSQDVIAVLKKHGYQIEEFPDNLHLADERKWRSL